MKARTMRVAIAACVAAMFNVPRMHAGDVGLPPCGTNLGRSGNVEVYYEKYERDIEQDFPGGPGEGKQEEDRVVARMTWQPGDRAAVHAEAGVTDSEGSEQAAPLFGLGVKVTAHDSESLRVDGFASATYVPEIEYSADGGVDYDQPGYVYVDYPDFRQEESYFEVNGGVIVSRHMTLDEKTAIVPYGGFQFSRLAGDEDYETVYHVMPSAEKVNGDLEDDGFFNMFAGLGVILDKSFGIRVEGRFIDQASMSAGVSYFF